MRLELEVHYSRLIYQLPLGMVYLHSGHVTGVVWQAVLMIISPLFNLFLNQAILRLFVSQLLPFQTNYTIYSASFVFERC